MSDYLLNSLESYFGEEAGRRLADLLARTGITCFDHLADGVPEGLLELAEVDESSFNEFLDEYGPQAIVRLKEELSILGSRVRELETQLKWVRDRIVMDVGSRTTRRTNLRRELSAVIGMLDALARSIRLCCDPHERIDADRTSTYEGVIDRAISRLGSLAEYSSEMEPIIRGLKRTRSILRKEPVAEDLYLLISYSISALSDVMKLIEGGTREEEALLWENILLKSELVSVLCKMRDD